MVEAPKPSLLLFLWLGSKPLFGFVVLFTSTTSCYIM